MAFVVEDGTGKADSNSYVSVAEADTYFTDRGNTEWIALTNEQKETYLILSAQWMDAEYCSKYIGYRKTEEQAMEWPRSCAQNSVNCNIYYSSTTIPVSLKKAQMEGGELIRANGGSNLWETTEVGLKKVDSSIDVIKDIKEYFYPTGGGTTTVYGSVKNNLCGLISSGVKVIRQ